VRSARSNWSLTSPGYFLGMRFALGGRDFNAQDRFDAPGVFIISRKRRRQKPAGRGSPCCQLLCGLDCGDAAADDHHGVVGDVRQSSPGVASQPTLLHGRWNSTRITANELQVSLRTANRARRDDFAVPKAASELIREMAVKFTTLEEMVGPRLPRHVSGRSWRDLRAAALLWRCGVYA